MLMPISAPGHAVDIGTDFDSFGGVTLAADATGAPYVGGADLVLESATFDPTSFTLQPGEGVQVPTHATRASGAVACPAPARPGGSSSTRT